MSLQMLEVITEDELRGLLEDASSPALSLYLPMVQEAVESEENHLQLKSVLEPSVAKLEERGLRRRDIDQLLEPLHALLEDRDFWLNQLGALAIIRTARELRYYKLPFHVPKKLVVADKPYVRPMFKALFPRTEFYLLALSLNHVRLLRCTRHGAAEVDLSRLEMPGSIEEALRFDDLQKPELQHHPTTGPGRSPVGQAPTEQRHGGRRHGFHGHGESGEGVKTQTKGFFQQVDDAIVKSVEDSGLPLGLAGVRSQRSLYTEVSNYRGILDDGVEGNPDRESNERLHELALPIVSRLAKDEVEREKDKFKTLEAAGRGSVELVEVLEAATRGRVEALFLRDDAETWGRFEPETRTVEKRDEQGPGDIDLLDLAARETFTHAGRVYELSDDDAFSEALAASFRY